MKIIAKLPAPVIAVESNIFANGICDWSPDGKYFAWSCSNFFVQLMKISSRCEFFPGVISLMKSKWLCLNSIKSCIFAFVNCLFDKI